MAESGFALEINGVFKKYSNTVLNDVSFNVKRGETVALVGANGAGKSTLIKIILGLVLADQGDIKIFGQDPALSLKQSKVGYLPELPGYWPEFSGRELLKFSGQLHSVKDENLASKIYSIFSVLGLKKRSSRRMGGYSKGMLQRTGYAQALFHNPDLLILDEPMSGLDPRAQEKVKSLLSRLNKNGKSFLISTHSLDDIRSLCHRVVVLEQTKLVLNGPVEEVLNKLTEKYKNEEPWDEDPYGDENELFQ